MTTREKTFYNFGVIFGLAHGFTKELINDADSPSVKRVALHIAQLGDDWAETIEEIRTEGERVALQRGHAYGKKLRESIAA